MKCFFSEETQYIPNPPPPCGRTPHPERSARKGGNRCRATTDSDENKALRSQISRRSKAILRINETLDLATVLHEVVECACALTSARYGVLQGRPERCPPRIRFRSGLYPASVDR